ncbi:MAG: hypothetical protein LBQ96_01025 [Fusobacteriaceae bacterium]|jgi:hypothetical protein|nr:hypothetical protein [Fusobacteriaceae bacterium]
MRIVILKKRIFDLMTQFLAENTCERTEDAAVEFSILLNETLGIGPDDLKTLSVQEAIVKAWIRKRKKDLNCGCRWAGHRERWSKEGLSENGALPEEKVRQAEKKLSWEASVLAGFPLTVTLTYKAVWVFRGLPIYDYLPDISPFYFEAKML